LVVRRWSFVVGQGGFGRLFYCGNAGGRIQIGTNLGSKLWDDVGWIGGRASIEGALAWLFSGGSGNGSGSCRFSVLGSQSVWAEWEMFVTAEQKVLQSMAMQLRISMSLWQWMGRLWSMGEADSTLKEQDVLTIPVCFNEELPVGRLPSRSPGQSSQLPYRRPIRE
jgi:hypothetical protein